MRGLKFLGYKEPYFYVLESHPSRVRGLKLHARRRGARPVHVAPFTGAWIEIGDPGSEPGGPLVAPFTGAWIEILLNTYYVEYPGGRTLHGCVD